MKKLIIMAMMALIVIANFEIFGQSDADKGLQIARKADSLDNGWRSSSMAFSMTLKNKSGQETVRNLHSKMVEVQNDGDKSLVVFDNPADVKGTASLVFSHKAGDDDQWLYLPALKEVKRISSSNKSGPFMGSEFAYEDMASQEVEKYTYKFIGIAEVNSIECFLVERYPVDKKSGYTRQQVWFNKINFRIEKIDYYDRKDALLKTLTYADYHKYLGKYWRAKEMHMVNLVTRKETLLRFSDYQFGIGLTEADFTQNTLKNAR
jgi:outer membrane lipoprotein-sorting protein